MPVPCNKLIATMYEDFKVTDRWTGEELRCEWKGTVVAIATRHADATDIRFSVNGRPASRWTWDARQAVAVLVVPSESIRDRVSLEWR